MLVAVSVGSAVLSLAYLRRWLSLPDLMVANAAMLAGMPFGLAARPVPRPTPDFVQVRKMPHGPIFLAIQAPRRFQLLMLLAIAASVVCAGSVGAVMHGRPGLLAMSAVAAALSFLILLSILNPGAGSYMRLLQFVRAPFLRTLLPLAILPLAIAMMLGSPVALAAAAMSVKASALLLATGCAAAVGATCAWLVGDILRHAGRRTEPFMLANMAALGLCVAMPAIAVPVLLAQTTLVLRHGRKFWNAYARTAA